MTYGAEELAAEFRLSHEIIGRLTAYDAALLDGSSRHNLIARSTVEDRWSRHYRDSAQLFALLPDRAKTLVDLGSGAGFPGLVLAAMGEANGLTVTLVESIGKKAAFLSAAIAAMRLMNARVLPERVESVTVSPPDAITARALARLGKLLSYAHEIADEKTVLIFPKGQDVEVELTDAAKSWHMDVVKHPSVTSPGSTILEIRHLKPKGRHTPAKNRSRRER